MNLSYTILKFTIYIATDLQITSANARFAGCCRSAENQFIASQQSHPSIFEQFVAL